MLKYIFDKLNEINSECISMIYYLTARTHKLQLLLMFYSSFFLKQIFETIPLVFCKNDSWWFLVINTEIMGTMLIFI